MERWIAPARHAGTSAHLIPATVAKVEVAAAEYRLGAELRRTMLHFVHRSAHVIEAHGLTPERYDLLLAIKGAPDGSQRATIGELASELELAHSSLTQLARRAEDAGLLRREVSRRDARVRYLRLTEQGARQLAGAVADLRPERQRMTEIVQNLSTAPSPLPPPTSDHEEPSPHAKPRSRPLDVLHD
jgi:DNA-binding MarR family transcriptional regulator